MLNEPPPLTIDHVAVAALVNMAVKVAVLLLQIGLLFDVIEADAGVAQLQFTVNVEPADAHDVPTTLAVTEWLPFPTPLNILDDW